MAYPCQFENGVMSEDLEKKLDEIEREMIKASRMTAIGLLEAFAAGDLPYTDEEKSYWEQELATCEAQLAELDRAERP